METPSSTSKQKQQIDRMAETAHSAVDRATQAAAQVADRFGEKADELLEMKENWVEGARDYVREHPVASLGIALAAGYLLSMITRR
jgi:ElaB/YqjD/DUF883 family membrane-anchored ribosome-binding protein